MGRRGGSASSAFFEDLSGGEGFALWVRRRGLIVGVVQGTAKGVGGKVGVDNVTCGRGVVGRVGLRKGLRETRRKERRGRGQMRAVWRHCARRCVGRIERVSDVGLMWVRTGMVDLSAVVGRERDFRVEVCSFVRSCGDQMRWRGQKGVQGTRGPWGKGTRGDSQRGVMKDGGVMRRAGSIACFG